jgi:hypothetical protein
MKKTLLLLSFTILTIQIFAQEKISNKYADAFRTAYATVPEVPAGILEAVSFCNTRFEHLSPENTEESCTGMPAAYGPMGLIADGKGYFQNTLSMISDLSGMEKDRIMQDPSAQILAFAKAYKAAAALIPGSAQKAGFMKVLAYLSELPRSTEGQIYAFSAQQYSIFSFLDDPRMQKEYGFPDHGLDGSTLFGEENFKVLSAASITLSDESIYGGGETFSATRAMASGDYGPALWTPAASCNYSGRSGTSVSAVTIHTVQGSYAGCISWFQNCSAGVSAHYVVRSSDGQITQMVQESMKAWHVGVHNPYTIGIEHEGYISSASWYTNAMYASSAALVRDICSSGYGINPLRCYYGAGCSGGYSSCELGSCTTIKGHQMFSGQTHTDPGPNWNWSKYYHLINNAPLITTITTPTGTFTDSGGSSSSYSDDERKLTLIQPAGATSITLDFSSFNTEAGWDYLFIYDGATTSAPLIGQYDGTTGPGTITSSGGSLLVEFRSDCATTAPGWVASWTSNSSTPTSSDVTAPTTMVSVNTWETGSFTAGFSDSDEAGGSGLEKSYYQVIDFNGSEWRANSGNGFFADNFDVAIHPDWTTATGSWNIASASLAQTDEALSNTNLHASLNQSLSNRYLYHFSAKIDGSGTSRRAGFHFFCDDASLTNRGNSYFVWFRVDDAKLQIYEVISDSYGSPVVDVPLSTAAGQWYDYKIIYDRITGKMTIYRDNQIEASWTDPTPLSTGNAISFRTGNATMHVNELKIYRSRPLTSATVTVGPAPTNDIRYQNASPTVFSAKVKSICADSAGNLSAIYYQNINIDWTPPTLPDTINDGTAADITYTSSSTELSANWSVSEDPHSALARYYYAIGTSPGATDVVGWTDNWYNQQATVSGLSLIDGQTYYFSVKAENGAGLQSAAVSSNGQTVQLSTGINENPAISFHIYPNPVTETATLLFNLPANDDIKIIVSDVLGKTMLVEEHSLKAGSQQLSIKMKEEAIAAGVYFISLQHSGGTQTIRTVIQ